MTTKHQQAYPPIFEHENDLDWTTPYPCHVCGELFRSRHMLATHPHAPKKSEATGAR